MRAAAACRAQAAPRFFEARDRARIEVAQTFLDDLAAILVVLGAARVDVGMIEQDLLAAGFTVPLAGMGDASYRGKHGYPAVTDGHVRDWDPGSLAGIIAPGGWAGTTPSPPSWRIKYL